MEGAGTEGSSWESKGSKYDSLRGEKNTSVHILVGSTKTCTIPSSLVQEERESQKVWDPKEHRSILSIRAANWCWLGGSRRQIPYGHPPLESLVCEMAFYPFKISSSCSRCLPEDQWTIGGFWEREHLGQCSHREAVHAPENVLLPHLQATLMQSIWSPKQTRTQKRENRRGAS